MLFRSVDRFLRHHEQHSAGFAITHRDRPYESFINYFSPTKIRGCVRRMSGRDHLSELTVMLSTRLTKYRQVTCRGISCWSCCRGSGARTHDRRIMSRSLGVQQDLARPQKPVFTGVFRPSCLARPGGSWKFVGQTVGHN